MKKTTITIEIEHLEDGSVNELFNIEGEQSSHNELIGLFESLRVKFVTEKLKNLKPAKE